MKQFTALLLLIIIFTVAGLTAYFWYSSKSNNEARNTGARYTFTDALCHSELSKHSDFPTLRHINECYGDEQTPMRAYLTEHIE